jgi:hypothetical protein
MKTRASRRPFVAAPSRREAFLAQARLAGYHRDDRAFQRIVVDATPIASYEAARGVAHRALAEGRGRSVFVPAVQERIAMKRVLVIDDRRLFASDEEAQYTHAPSSIEADALLWADFSRFQRSARGDWTYDEIWLDHDLGPGDDVRKIVIDLEVWAKRGVAPPYVIRILTSNPVGREYIVAALGRSYRIEP